MKVQELGVRRAYPDLRVGVSTTRLLGVQRKPDPSAVPDEAFWDIVNGRLNGGRLVCRGGQAKVNTGGVTDGCPELIFDGGDIGQRDGTAYVSPGFYGANGGNIRLSKMDTDGTFTEVSTDTSDNLAHYGNYIYYRNSLTQFKRFILGTTSTENTFSIAKIDANDVGSSMGGTANSLLWIIYGYSSTLTPTNGRIYSWDGATVTEENSFSYADTSSEINFDTNDTWRLFPFNGGWMSASTFQGGIKRFLYRNGAGTLTFPRFSGTINANDIIGLVGSGRSAILGSKLYMPVSHDIFLGNAVQMIQSFDGSNVVTERTLESAAFPTLGLGGIVEFGDSIYWAYTASSGTILRLGKYDGSTWTDSFATIATGLSGASVQDINEHAGSLYVFTNGKGVYKSNGSNLTSWADINGTAYVRGLTVSVVL